MQIRTLADSSKQWLHVMSGPVQRDNMFYRAISYVMPVTIMRIPYSAVEAVVWSNLTYWEINMAPVASRYYSCYIQSSAT